MVLPSLSHSEFERSALRRLQLIPGSCRFGLEGLVTFRRENEYDAETYEIAVPSDPTDASSPSVRIGVFDKVLVEISVEKVSPASGSFPTMHADQLDIPCRTRTLNAEG